MIKKLVFAFNEVPLFELKLDMKNKKTFDVKDYFIEGKGVKIIMKKRSTDYEGLMSFFYTTFDKQAPMSWYIDQIEKNGFFNPLCINHRISITDVEE